MFFLFKFVIPLVNTKTKDTNYLTKGSCKAFWSWYVVYDGILNANGLLYFIKWKHKVHDKTFSLECDGYYTLTWCSRKLSNNVGSSALQTKIYRIIRIILDIGTLFILNCKTRSSFIQIIINY